ncbi:MAG: AAA family ATPase [Proteobacteria bacterium]|nr:AAA family ATPase [Pseudomonadota bacterium]
MRINSLYIKEFRNLREFSIDFVSEGTNAEGTKVTFNSHAIIGQNGSGKSNLLEAIIMIFRDLDLKNKPPFAYRISYEIRNNHVEVEADANETPAITVNGKKSSATALSKDENGLLPKNVFAYYSGKNDRIEELFHRHQKKFYDDLLSDETMPLRRLFLCRNVHSQFVLLAYLIDNDPEVKRVLSDLGIEDLESVLFSLKRPYWFGSNPSEAIIKNGDNRFWYARGKVRDFLDKLWQYAVAPIDCEESRTVDFRDRKEKFELLYLFLPDENALHGLANSFADEATTEPTAVTFFKYLESTYISDLIDEVRIKVKHKNTEGDISFRELSEGEQQLLTVLGLMRLTKEEETLFLLDEPDTHLNPIWKLRYFDDIKNVIGKDSSSQIIITTHDPLMIGSLKKEQVRILNRDDGFVVANEPSEDPQGMGVSGLLKSDMFGLRSTLDNPTQELLKERNSLVAKAGKETLPPTERARLEKLRVHLDDLGFMYESRDPMYQLFIEKMYEARSVPLEDMFSKAELDEQEKLAEKILKEMVKQDKQSQISEIAKNLNIDEA